MTLAELLRDVASLAPFDRGVAADVSSPGAGSTVTGIAYDSRQVSAGGVFVALRGAKDGWSRVRARSDRARSDRSGRRGAGTGRLSRAVDPNRRRAAGVGCSLSFVFRSSERKTAARGYHRHERQDDDLVRRAIDLRIGRYPQRTYRHGWLSGREPRVRGGPHHPGSARAAAHAARHGGAGLRCVRDGGVVSRPRLAPRRPPAFRCRRSSRT